MLTLFFLFWGMTCKACVMLWVSFFVVVLKADATVIANHSELVRFRCLGIVYTMGE